MNPWADFDRIDLGDTLLDRQIVGEDGTVVGKVDDLELRWSGRHYVVDALLVGADALADRFDSRLARLIRRAGKWFRSAEYQRIPISAIRKVEPTVVVTTAVAKGTASPAEDWLQRKLIGRIPGAGHASK